MPKIIPIGKESVNYTPIVFIAATTISRICYWFWGHENYIGSPEAGKLNQERVIKTT
jgi:hypothetical protein